MKEVEGLTQETSSLSSLYHGNLILLNFFDPKISCKKKVFLCGPSILTITLLLQWKVYQILLKRTTVEKRNEKKSLKKN